MNNQNGLRGDKDNVDPKLQKLYHQLPKEQPSAELDAKILAAATISTSSSNLNQKKPHRWQAPFALAASVVMVSSVTLYLHENNPTAFDASVPTTQAPMTEMAKPVVKDTANVMTKQLVKADKEITTQKAKDAFVAQSEEAQMTSAADLNDNKLFALEEKKADIANSAKQMAEIAATNKSAKSIQSAIIAKEQEARQAKIETDQFAASAPAAYAPAPPLSPAPVIAPAPQTLSQPETADLRSLTAGHLQDPNRPNRSLSAAMTQSDKPVVLEKSNTAPALAAASMAAAPMNMGSISGATMPTQQSTHDDVTRADNVQNISTPVLSIEGVAMGMSREQLVKQGLMCYVDVCHLDLSKPQQANYWGISTQNSHLTAYLSHQVVSKLVLQQKNAQLNQVKAALSNVGIASQQSCRDEKGVLVIGRQLGTNLFNVRSMGIGLSLAICPQTK